MRRGGHAGWRGMAHSRHDCLIKPWGPKDKPQPERCAEACRAAGAPRVRRTDFRFSGLPVFPVQSRGESACARFTPSRGPSG